MKHPAENLPVNAPENIPNGLPQAACVAAVELLERAAVDESNLASLHGGGVVEQFETIFARCVGTQFALAVSSGTAALHTALLACDFGPGDEIIVSPYGWGQTVSAILMTGATPVFADINKQTGNLEPDAVADLIGSRTVAVLVTHLFGCPADMVSLGVLCRNAGLMLIADAAQALGASLDGQPIAAWADITCFSLGPGKAITTGEGGVVACDDPNVLERMILVSQHPLRSLMDVEDPILRRSTTQFSMSYRLSALAAAIGLAQLAALAGVIEKRQRAVHRLILALGEVESLGTPPILPGVGHAFFTLVLHYRPDQGLPARATFVEALQAAGVPAQAGPVRVPLNLRQPFKCNGDQWYPKALQPRSYHPSWQSGACPNAERLSEQELLIENSSRWQQVPGKRIDEIAKVISDLLRTDRGSGV